MPTGIYQKFKVKIDKTFGFHIGIAFCVEPTNSLGKHDTYLMLCLGIIDISIGFITEYEEV